MDGSAIAGDVSDEVEARVTPHVTIGGRPTLAHVSSANAWLPPGDDVAGDHQFGIILGMKNAPRTARTDETNVARTIRFPKRLRAKIGADAERCGRSFEAQVIAILRRHYGEDVDIAPGPDAIVALAVGSLAGVSPTERRKLTRRLRHEDV